MKTHNLSRADDSALLLHVREHMARMVDSARDFAIMGYDVQRRAIVWNPGAVRLFGFQPNDMLGKFAWDFFTPEDQQAGIPDQEFEAALITGRAEDERWHKHKDGHRLFVSGVMTLVQNSAGTVLGFAKIVRDITSLKHAQEEMARTLAKTEAAVAVKTELLSAISRDIAIPAEEIHALAQQLGAHEPIGREYVQKLKDSAGRLRLAVNNMRHVSALQESAQASIFTLSDIIEDAVQSMELQVRQKKVKLIRHKNDIESLCFEASPDRVRHILVNLYRTALEFAEGEMQWHTAIQPTDQPGIESVCLNIHAQGSTIPSTDHEPSIAVTKYFAALIGGTFTVNNVSDRQWVFTACLPLARSQKTVP